MTGLILCRLAGGEVGDNGVADVPTSAVSRRRDLSGQIFSAEDNKGDLTFAASYILTFAASFAASYIASFAASYIMVQLTEFEPTLPVREDAIAALTDPASIRSYLDGIGLSARPPPIAQARPSPQSEFEPLLAASGA